MNTIRILLLLSLFSISANATEYLDNTVLVRFNEFHKDDITIDRLLEQSKAKISRRILPLEASLKYGKTTQYKSSNNSRYKEILDAEEPVLRTYVVTYEGDQNPEKFCQYLMKTYKEIDIAEPYRLQKLQAFIPNDQYIAEQEDALILIKAYEAWEIYSGDSNIVIGISDNGIDQFHPDLRDNIAINNKEIPNNNIDDDNNGFIDDYNGFNLDGSTPGQLWGNTYIQDNHGTLAAGIAGADFNNEIGVAGIGGYSKIFPIRIGTEELDNGSTAFGYESMIFAARAGIKVLNCSWGRESIYSELEQMIVTYAVANDVAIVAAGGNQEKQDQVTKFYPSGYKGVLGVGVVSSFDSFLSVSLLGPQTRIMAPASKYTTTLNGKYDNPGAATSFSTPIVAGAVALARGQHPELNATQVLEFVRQSTDDISDKRTFYKEITPGRLNMLKMVTTDPMSIPGIMIEEVILKDRTGAEQERFFLGDTVNVELVLKNVLGEANNLNLNLSIAYPDSFKPLTFTDSTFNNLNLKTNETKTISGFKYIITNEYDEYINFRLDITDGNGYKDFILYDYKSIPIITTFENQDIKFSISDRGTFGYAPTDGKKRRRDGVGFIDKSYGDALHFSGIYLVENENIVIASFPLSNVDGSFRSVKPFYNPSYSGSIMTSDPFEPTRALIEQTVELPKQGHWVRIKLDVTDSAALGSKYSLGYEFDWDMGVEYQYDRNVTGFMEEARPENIPFEKFSAIYTGHKDSSQVFGTAFYSFEDDAIAQAGGYTSQTTNSEFYSNSLKLGKVNITDTVGDMFNIIGMRFTNEFAPFETKTCYLCVAGGEDKTALTESLKECASNITSVEIDYENNIHFNSSNNSFEISSSSYKGVEVYRIDGSIVMQSDDNSFNLNNLNQGIYLVKIEFADRFIIKKISIIR
jgi:subtilase family protein